MCLTFDSYQLYLRILYHHEIRAVIRVEAPYRHSQRGYSSLFGSPAATKLFCWCRSNTLFTICSAPNTKQTLSTELVNIGSIRLLNNQIFPSNYRLHAVLMARFRTSSLCVPQASSKRQHHLNKHLYRPSTFLTSYEPPVYMDEEDERSAYYSSMQDPSADESVRPSLFVLVCCIIILSVHVFYLANNLLNKLICSSHLPPLHH